MSVNLAAGSAQSVQQSLVMMRQTLQVDQLVAAAMVEATSQASKPVVTAPATETRGQNVDLQA